jgi:hypothetical protein
VEPSNLKLLEAFIYISNWKYESDFEPSRWIDFPDRDGSGFWMSAGTKGIHRNDPGKVWTVGPLETSNECILAMAELLPTVNTNSDYGI